MKKFKINTLMTACTLALGMTAGTAVAGITWYSPLTGFQDDDLEWSYLDVNSNGNLDVGDQIFTVLELSQTFSIAPTGSSALITGGELTGISAIEVKTKSAATCTALAPCTYTFGEVAGGMDAIYDALVPTNTDTLGAGALAALWFDTSPDLDLVAPNCTSAADCAAKGTDGTLWEVDGFAGDGDELWLSTGVISDNLATVAAGNATAKFGFYNFALSILYNGTGQNLEEQACAPFCGLGAGANNSIGITGSGDLLGGQNLTNGAFARSDFDFQKAVPEPATLALLGVGLLGMGASLRKKVR